MDGSDIFWVFSYVSSRSLLHISFKQVLLKYSNLKQCNIVREVHIAVELRLTKMLDSAAFYTLYALNIPVTFQENSKYILGIPAALCLNSETFEMYSAAILRVF